MSINKQVRYTLLFFVMEGESMQYIFKKELHQSKYSGKQQCMKDLSRNSPVECYSYSKILCINLRLLFHTS